jgi:hypothetical protein
VISVTPRSPVASAPAHPRCRHRSPSMLMGEEILCLTRAPPAKGRGASASRPASSLGSERRRPRLRPSPWSQSRKRGIERHSDGDHRRRRGFGPGCSRARKRSGAMVFLTYEIRSGLF